MEIFRNISMITLPFVAQPVTSADRIYVKKILSTYTVEAM